MQTVQTSKTTLIQQLNDQFRRSLSGGRILLTPGIAELDDATQNEIFRQVIEFQDFNDANDPYGEHDFVAFEFNGVHVFAKIDYYSLDLLEGSDDPSDSRKTTRVMTIMTAEEY